MKQSVCYKLIIQYSYHFKVYFVVRLLALIVGLNNYFVICLSFLVMTREKKEQPNGCSFSFNWL